MDSDPETNAQTCVQVCMLLSMQGFSFALWMLQCNLFYGGESLWREMCSLCFCMQACVCAEPSSLAILSCCHGAAWSHCETNGQVDLSVTLPLLAHHGCTKHLFTLNPMWETVSCGKKGTLPLLRFVVLIYCRMCHWQNWGLVSLFCLVQFHSEWW